jgi:nicotinamidase-related amidase
MADHLLQLPLTEKTVHICVDMQVIFSAAGIWPTPWMKRVLPVVREIAGRFPERTIFTRFITPEKPGTCPACGSTITEGGTERREARSIQVSSN